MNKPVCRECHFGYHVLCERPECRCGCLGNQHVRKLERDLCYDADAERVHTVG